MGERGWEVSYDRQREWSRVRRLDAAAVPGARDASVWLKELPDGLRVEVAMIDVLSAAGIAQVLAPLAVDRAKGWMLLPDGGPTLQQAWDETPDAAPTGSSWSRALRRYAQLQLAAAPLVGDLLAAGAPDRRTEALPALAANLVETLDPALGRWLDVWEEDAAILADSGIPDSIQHDDLHAGNVFAGSLQVFDWGDASVSHPWLSLAVAVQDPDEAAAQAAYVRAWCDALGRPMGGTEPVVAAARRLGRLVRAATWRRIETAGGLPTRFADAPLSWLRLAAAD